jgi:hypothetical protein
VNVWHGWSSNAFSVSKVGAATLAEWAWPALLGKLIRGLHSCFDGLIDDYGKRDLQSSGRSRPAGFLLVLAAP